MLSCEVLLCDTEPSVFNPEWSENYSRAEIQLSLRVLIWSNEHLWPVFIRNENFPYFFSDLLSYFDLGFHLDSKDN